MPLLDANGPEGMPSSPDTTASVKAEESQVAPCANHDWRMVLKSGTADARGVALDMWLLLGREVGGPCAAGGGKPAAW